MSIEPARSEEARTTYRNQAAQRVLAVFSAFGFGDSPLGVTEISRALGMSKNMVHRALATLADDGWIARAADGERYQLGWRVLALGSEEPSFDLALLARPFLEQIHALTGESIFLSVVSGDNRVTIDEILPPGPRVLRSSRGMPIPLHCTKMSRVLLAHLSDAEIAAYLKRAAPLARPMPFRDRESESVDGVWDDIRRIRVGGPVVWRNPVLTSAAYAIFPLADDTGRPHAIVTIGGPRERFDLPQIEALLPRITNILAPLTQHLQRFPATPLADDA